MTSETFKTKSKRLSLAFFVVFFGVAVPLLAAVLFGADWVSTQFQFERAVVFLLAMPLACGAFIAGGFAMEALDRRFGLRCPHCGHSLTFRRHPARIAASGVCPDCHESVFKAA
jgi:predicted RNA-binding Zn-ribbon protein involved in translation (DUF1610 family)